MAALRRRQAALAEDPASEANVETLFLDARLAKRRLMFRDPDLEPLERILFVKRHPYLASHNYSDILDSQFRPGGGICVLDIPRSGGRLEPSDAELTTLFDGSEGIARDPIASFDAETIFFAYRPNKSPTPGQKRYWHLMSMQADGAGSGNSAMGRFTTIIHARCPTAD